jgi:hypothetical protein|tara:strand:+ start:443 stop:973 length:531 start_codon:yes stop_codon:yes gene_type:complete
MNKKVLLITLPALLVLIYIFSAMHSLHQVHKALYYNDTQLSKKYIEWNELKNNFKNVFKANLIDKMINDKDVMKLGDLGFAMIEKVEKSWDLIIDSYFTPEGINLFLKKIINKNEIPEPNFITLMAGVTQIKFDSLNSFHIYIVNPKRKIPIFFKRIGIKWKVVEIEFTEEFFSNL